MIHFFGESIPQVLLQGFMVSYGIKGVNEYDLYLSVIVSWYNLLYNLYKLHKEAKFHGMKVIEYVICVLQLGVLLLLTSYFDVDLILILILLLTSHATSFFTVCL